MQKIKNMLHHNKDENVATSSHVTTTDSLDKNKDGRVDALDFQKPVSTTHHNPLDRNHDGKVDLKDLKPSASREAPINDAKLDALDRNRDGKVDALDFQGPVASSTAMGLRSSQERMIPTSSTLETSNMPLRTSQTLLMEPATAIRAEPANLERVEKETVVRQHIHTLEKEEIQPVIHREREQLEVRQITEQLHETQIQPTLVQQRELAPEVREVIVERSAPIQENYVAPTVQVDATMRSVQMNAPIVNETVKKTIVEEIQPVLDRDVIQTTLIQERKDIFEKIVEAPVVSRETTIVQDRGIVTGGSLEALAAQGFNVGGVQMHHNPLDRNFDGKVDLKDLTGQPGMTGTAHHNPLDRNFDGKVDMKDLAPQNPAQAPLRTL